MLGTTLKIYKSYPLTEPHGNLEAGVFTCPIFHVEKQEQAMEAWSSMGRAGRQRPYTTGASHSPALGFYLTVLVTVQDAMCRAGPNHEAGFLCSKRASCFQSLQRDP